MNGYNGLEFDGDAESLENLSPFAETPETEGGAFDESAEAHWNLTEREAFGGEGEEEDKEVEYTQRSRA